jgi:peptidoglycan/LPS O-acetylase OafA/YrhL
MANAAGLAVLILGLTAIVPVVTAFLFPFGAPAAGSLPNGWELVVFAAGCGLVAYGAVDRAPGPAYLGVATFAAFVVAVGPSDQDTLIYWPALILGLGVAVMFAGLRPRAPLPPEPTAYTAGSVPLASRSDEDEPVLRVRDDSPPA